MTHHPRSNNARAYSAATVLTRKPGMTVGARTLPLEFCKAAQARARQAMGEKFTQDEQAALLDVNQTVIARQESPAFKQTMTIAQLAVQPSAVLVSLVSEILAWREEAGLDESPLRLVQVAGDRRGADREQLLANGRATAQEIRELAEQVAEFFETMQARGHGR